MSLLASQNRTRGPHAAGFRRRLVAWYREHGRDLPWRRTQDPYAILVSELMLQQTQVATVLSYYSSWLRRFPDFTVLAAASESDVLHAWQGLGYYARARNLHAIAKTIVAEHHHGFPRSPDESRKLSGIGRYTANAIATFAFNVPVPIVEANTARLFARLMNLQVRIDSAAGQQQLWDFAAAMLPKSGAAEHNSALMDLGALICVSGQPKCGVCPVRRWCHAVEPATLPIKTERIAVRRITEDHAFALRRDRVLLEQSEDRWRGMWILPRLAAAANQQRILYSAEFPFTHHRITLRVCEAVEDAAATTPKRRSFNLDELNEIPMPSPHRRALNALLAQRHARQERVA